MIFNKRGWLFLPLLLGSALMAGGGFIRNFEEESLPEVEATGSLLAIDALAGTTPPTPRPNGARQKSPSRTSSSSGPPPPIPAASPAAPT